MSHSSTHHSFSVELAIKYGQEIATLIHHFQHWIKLNRRKKSPKHFKDGHWWTYQTREEIQNFLPYMNIDKIRWLTDLMVEKGILKKGNYNKSKIDKTIWYAFVNENEFLGEEDSNNVYESCKPQSSVVNPNPCVVYTNAIPDPKSSDPKTTDKEGYNKGRKAPPSADASALADFFLMKIKEKKPDFKPQTFNKWAYDFDLMIKDGRSLELAKEMICWLVEDLKNLVYVQSASKFRKDFDRIEMDMKVRRESSLRNQNRQIVIQAKGKYPDQLQDMKFDDKFVGNRKTGKEIPFNLPREQFLEAFAHLFGGQHVG